MHGNKKDTDKEKPTFVEENADGPILQVYLNHVLMMVERARSSD